MSPTLIKELPNRMGDAHGSSVQISVYGNIDLIEFPRGELNVFLDARQAKSTRSLLLRLNGTRGKISDIEALDGKGRLFFNASDHLKNKLFTAREKQCIYIEL